MNTLFKVTTMLALAITVTFLPNIAFAKKKNVLFIAVDDLKPILGCYGDPLIQTPNIDKLANQGIIFENNHCQQAVCATSRASLMTGMRPDITKVWDLKTFIRDKNPDILTMPQYFKQNGYITTGVGKIYDKRSVDNQHDIVSWTEKFEFEGDEKYFDPQYGLPALGYYQLSSTKKEAEKYMKEASEKGLEGYAVTAYAIIITKGNKSSVSFFTSDDISNFKVFVEGITNEGRICVGTAEFSVDKFRR